MSLKKIIIYSRPLAQDNLQIFHLFKDIGFTLSSNVYYAIKENYHLLQTICSTLSSNDFSIKRENYY